MDVSRASDEASSSPGSGLLVPNQVLVGAGPVFVGESFGEVFPTGGEDSWQVF